MDMRASSPRRVRRARIASVGGRSIDANTVSRRYSQSCRRAACWALFRRMRFSRSGSPSSAARNSPTSGASKGSRTTASRQSNCRSNSPDRGGSPSSTAPAAAPSSTGRKSLPAPRSARARSPASGTPGNTGSAGARWQGTGGARLRSPRGR